MRPKWSPSGVTSLLCRSWVTANFAFLEREHPRKHGIENIWEREVKASGSMEPSALGIMQSQAPGSWS